MCVNITLIIVGLEIIFSFMDFVSKSSPNNMKPKYHINLYVSRDRLHYRLSITNLNFDID